MPSLIERPPVERPPHRWHGGPCRTKAGLLAELEQPRQLVSNITPNWYASIMGTGIVAVATASLPVHVPGLRAAATVVWATAALLFVGLTIATALHWILYPETARSHHRHPVMSQFYGAPPMAALTVGAGTLLVGRDVFGPTTALTIDWVLWSAGTLAGLATAAAVPYLLFTRLEGVDGTGAFGGWLMPVVPPMVSASTGALLVPHTPAGQPRLTLVLCCYAMFGLALIASLIIITLIWQRLATHGVGESRMMPTLWIVLGPLGQSITAANLLGAAAATVLPRPYSTALQAFGVIYGVPVWGFAALWASIAAAVTVRRAREGLPFSLTWWSFTFPLGTWVTGTSALALHTGSSMFRSAAGLLYLALVGAWLLVAARTVHDTYRGTLLVGGRSDPNLAYERPLRPSGCWVDQRESRMQRG